VAVALTHQDALGAHLKDELGIETHTRARPLLAAVASALSFAVFALVPVLAALLAPSSARTLTIAGVSLLSLAASGILGARLGGAPALLPALRVTVGGAMAMALGAGVGRFL
jgi:VIT1/CCC1 family predicted Fe2+/Mn2+ transporter